MASSERLDLLGMLWYHSAKPRREAESCLESSTEDSCYIIREDKGSLYLSARHRSMLHHLPILHTEHGYILKDHYNAFRTLQELVSHHQKHAVYVEGGEFALKVSCHKDFSAITVKYINDFHGACTVRVKEDSITIMKSSGKEIGVWTYSCIREFRFDDEKFQFSFKSGRRGPFGVANYLFKLHSRTYYNLRETVNRIADGKAGVSGADVKGDNSEATPPPVPRHAPGRARKQGTHEITYDDLPTVRSVGPQRSSSIPNLSETIHGSHVFERKDHSSTRSNPLKSNSSHSSLRSSEDKDQTDSKLARMKDSPLLNRKDSETYQIPRPATETIYSMPRPASDPRNDYFIPKPTDKTYMSPQSVRRQMMHRGNDSGLALLSTRILQVEHNYDEIDKHCK